MLLRHLFSCQTCSECVHHSDMFVFTFCPLFFSLSLWAALLRLKFCLDLFCELVPFYCKVFSCVDTELFYHPELLKKSIRESCDAFSLWWNNWNWCWMESLHLRITVRVLKITEYWITADAVWNWWCLIFALQQYEAALKGRHLLNQICRFFVWMSVYWRFGKQEVLYTVWNSKKLQHLHTDTQKKDECSTYTSFT